MPSSNKPMILESELKIELLKPEHSELVTSFSCGEEDEDLFLKKDALANQNLKLSETYLLFEQSRPNIISYITLTLGSFKLSPNKELDGIVIRDKSVGIYTNNMPCMFIGKLATDKEEIKRGAGKYLIKFAIKKAIELNEIFPLPFVALHAYPAKVSYYEELGFRIAFTPSTPDPETITMYLHLFEE